MSGFEIAQYLRENYENGIYDFLPPMIAFTANVMQSEQRIFRNGHGWRITQTHFKLRIYTIVCSNFFADESESIIEMNDDNELSQQFDLALIETLGKSKNFRKFIFIQTNYAKLSYSIIKR